MPPRESANTTSAVVPLEAAIQNWRDTRSPVLSTAISAVVSGMKAAITAACADVVRCNANASRIGHPNTAPTMV